MRNRVDLERTAQIMGNIKNPPGEITMPASTTHVEIGPKNLIGDSGVVNTTIPSTVNKPTTFNESGPKTWEPSQMWKDTKKGLNMFLGTISGNATDK